MAREHPPRTPSQEWRRATHHHHQRTPARSGEEPHPGPQLGVAREHPPRTLSQEWRGATHHHHRTPARSGGEPHLVMPQKPADLSQEWRRTTPPGPTSRPQPGVAGSRTRDPQPGVARDHPPPPAAGPSQEWRGRAHKHLGQEWRAAAPPSTTTAPKPGVLKDPPPNPTQLEGGGRAKGAHRGRRRGAQPQWFGSPPGDLIGPILAHAIRWDTPGTVGQRPEVAPAGGG